MITKNFKAIVSLSKKQYSKLALQGYLDIKGQKLVYSPDDTLYVTNDIEYVRYDTDKQKLTEIEKQNARTNIDAAAKSDIKTYLHKIDMTLSLVETPTTKYDVQFQLTSTSANKLEANDIFKKYEFTFICCSYIINNAKTTTMRVNSDETITFYLPNGLTTNTKICKIYSMTDSVVEL